MLIFGFLLFVSIIATTEIPKLLKEDQTYSLSFYTVLLLIGCILTTLYALEFKLPNPIDGIIYLFKPLSTRIIGIFN